MYKVTIKGYFEFANTKSFELALKTYQQRWEVYYKKDVLIKEQDIFSSEKLTMEIPRLIVQGADKSWRNTISILNLMAEYAWAGFFHAWCVNDKGETVEYHYVEPRNDRGVVIDYLNGREMLRQGGREKEAITALSAAIEKFDRHAPALERRGFAYYTLKNFNLAMADFNRSIEINACMAESYIGKALVKKELKDYQGAITDLELALLHTIPLQATYWQARRLKGECHFYVSEFDKAVFDLKFFTKRAFKKEDPNYVHRHDAYFTYGKALLETGAYKDAITAFDCAMELNNRNHLDHLSADTLFYRGVARHKSGSTGFDQDIQAAADLGSEKAVALLEELSFQYN